MKYLEDKSIFDINPEGMVAITFNTTDRYTLIISHRIFAVPRKKKFKDKTFALRGEIRKLIKNNPQIFRAILKPDSHKHISINTIHRLSRELQIWVTPIKYGYNRYHLDGIMFSAKYWDVYISNHVLSSIKEDTEVINEYYSYFH